MSCRILTLSQLYKGREEFPPLGRLWGGRKEEGEGGGGSVAGNLGEFGEFGNLSETEPDQWLN